MQNTRMEEILTIQKPKQLKMEKQGLWQYQQQDLSGDDNGLKWFKNHKFQPLSGHWML